MIYFLQAQTSPYLIKIGFTNKPDITSRIFRLKLMNAVDLTLILVLPGSSQEEAKLHKYFFDERVKGEWFLPSSKVTEFLLKNAKNNVFPLHKINKKDGNDRKGSKKIKDHFLSKFVTDCQSTLQKMYPMEE